jgi:hypothetical protein
VGKSLSRGNEKQDIFLGDRGDRKDLCVEGYHLLKPTPDTIFALTAKLAFSLAAAPQTV